MKESHNWELECKRMAGIQHLVYVFLGLAETEEAKLYRRPQWQRCCELLDPLFRPFGKKAVVIPDFAFEVALPARKGDPPGTRRVSYKKAPAGRLKWNDPNRDQLSDWFTQPYEHPVVQIETVVTTQTGSDQPPEALFRLLRRDASPTSLYNQIVLLTVSERLHTECPAAEWDLLIGGLGSLARAARIARCLRPFGMTRPRGNYTVMSTLMDETFTRRHDSLELDDHWQEWELLQ